MDAKMLKVGLAALVSLSGCGRPHSAALKEGTGFGSQKIELAFSCRPIEDPANPHPERMAIFRAMPLHGEQRFAVRDMVSACGARRLWLNADVNVMAQTMTFDFHQEGFAHCLCDYTTDVFGLASALAPTAFDSLSLRVLKEGEEYGAQGFTRRVADLPWLP